MTMPGRPKRRQADPKMAATAQSRFFPKVDTSEPDGCWRWTAATNGAGYGVLAMSRDGVKVLAHRFSYELVHGPIPDGLVVDHLCRTPLCVNPLHLEAVPQRTNNLRGSSPSARQAKQTHCVHGHEFTPENTYVRAGHRSCRACHRAQELKRYYRRRADFVQALVDNWDAAS